MASSDIYILMCGFGIGFFVFVFSSGIRMMFGSFNNPKGYHF